MYIQMHMEYHGNCPSCVCFYMASPPLRSSSNRETQAMRSTWFARVKRGSSCRPTRARTRHDRSFSGQDMMGAIMVESRYVSEICGIKSGDLWSLGGNSRLPSKLSGTASARGWFSGKELQEAMVILCFFFPRQWGGCCSDTTWILMILRYFKKNFMSLCEWPCGVCEIISRGVDYNLLCAEREREIDTWMRVHASMWHLCVRTGKLGDG